MTILLHGFPEFWWSWRYYVEPLVQAGLHVVIPDQRGYNLSSKPEAIEDYSLDVLCQDVIAIADSYQARKFNVVGHDWGGIVAWRIAVRYPERLHKVVVMNAPHPGAAFRYAAMHPGQYVRSAYAAFFQLPTLPESVLRYRNFLLLRNTMIATARKGTFSARDLASYCAAWSQPAALSSMLNWYRALWHERKSLRADPVIPSVLLIWGRRDVFLQPALALESIRLCERGRIRWFKENGHWLHHEQRIALISEIGSFLCPKTTRVSDYC